MNARRNFRTQLGLTQGQLALLLGVSRSQFSMYELGLRELPLPAQSILTTLSFQAPVSETRQPAAERGKDHRLFLRRLSDQNDYRIKTVERAIAALCLKREAGEKRAALRGLIGTGAHRDAEERKMSVIADLDLAKGTANAEKLLALEIKLEGLKAEKAALQRRLKEAGGKK